MTDAKFVEYMGKLVDAAGFHTFMSIAEYDRLVDLGGYISAAQILFNQRKTTQVYYMPTTDARKAVERARDKVVFNVALALGA